MRALQQRATMGELRCGALARINHHLQTYGPVARVDRDALVLGAQ
jgi:hypothetical protein